MTVEFPKLSSLASELIKFSLLSLVFLGITVSSILMMFGKVHPLNAGAIGFGVAFVWVIIFLLWTKGKIEELFSKLMYVIDTIEEEKGGKAIVPIPIHEEILGVIESIKRILDSFEEKYEKNIRDLEVQLEAISENTAKILNALEKLEEGHTDVDLPYGLDPVGAIGQSLQQVINKYVKKLSLIRSHLQECEETIRTVSLLLENKEDKIDMSRVKEELMKLKEAEENIKRELEFFKDT